MTIDNYDSAKALTHQLDASVPFRVRPGKQLLKLMKSKSIPMSADQYYPVEKVIYGGDEGGITCMLQGKPTDKELIGSSITHLIIDPAYPLAEQVKAYQQERRRRLWLEDQRGFAALARQSKSAKQKKRSGGFGA